MIKSQTQAFKNAAARISALRLVSVLALGASALLLSATQARAGECDAGNAGTLAHKAIGNITIDTGSYSAGSYNGTNNVNSGSFSYNGDGGTYESRWGMQNGFNGGNYMSWIKKVDTQNASYGKKIDALSGAHTVTFTTRIEKPCGADKHASRFGIDIWTLQDNGEKVEIMINEDGWAGPGTALGTFTIPGTENGIYKVWGPYRNGNNGDHLAWVLQRQDSGTSKKRISGKVDVHLLLDFMRGKGLKNDKILEIRVGREATGTALGSYGRFFIDEITIPDLKVFSPTSNLSATQTAPSGSGS